MSLPYTVVKIYASEESRCEGKPLPQAVMNYLRGLKVPARCLVARAVEGCYENGETATFGVEALSYNMPLEITVIVPSAEKDAVLPGLERLVGDGLMTVEEKNVVWHRSGRHVIPRQVRVKDVMTKAPVSVPFSAPAAAVVKVLLSSGFRGLPVTDEAGRPAGLITQGDLLRRAGLPLQLGLLPELAAHHLGPLQQALEKFHARELMSPSPTCAREDDLLPSAVETMLKKGLKRLPVTDKAGRLAGMLSRLDVFKTILDKAPDWDALRRSGVAVSGAGTVKEAMRRDTPAVGPDAPVWDAVGLIETTDIKRVAVLDKDGKLLGLVSDKVLLGAFSGHRAGLWDYFLSRLSFTPAGEKHKELIKAMQARTAGEIMLTEVFSVGEDEPLAAAIKLMVDRKLKRVPVLDKAGVFKGMLTRDSILRAGAA